MSDQKSNDACLFRELPYVNAVHVFNSQQWHTAHDLFEELWYEATGDLRELLQGIIQISVAEYHLGNGNRKGSILLMAEGLNHLYASESVVVGYDLQRLRDVVRMRLSALQTNVDLTDLPKPHLSLMHSTEPMFFLNGSFK